MKQVSPQRGKLPCFFRFHAGEPACFRVEIDSCQRNGLGRKFVFFVILFLFDLG